METYSKLANSIVEMIGGKENVVSLTHCVTRLRFKLNDEKAVKEKELKQLKGVMGVVKSGNQYQVIIGQDVSNVYEEVAKLIANASSLEKEKNSHKDIRSIIDNLFSVLAAVFTPLIPAMQGMGFIKVILVIVDQIGISSINTTVQLLNILSNSFFYFLPLLVACSTAKQFGGNVGLSIMLVSFLIHPSFTELFTKIPNVNLFGIGVSNITYSGSVLPALLSVILLSYVQKWLEKILPGVLKTVFMSVLVLLIMMPISLLVIGPIGNVGGEILVKVFTSLYNFSPMLSGAIFGGLWQIIIIVGMHWLILTLIQFPNINHFGVDRVTVAFAPSIMCQIAAGFAVALRVKNKNVRSNVLSLTITSLLSGGVIEPVMYGVNIKYKKPFYFVLLGGAVGGAIVGLSRSGITAPVMFGIYTLPAFFGTGFTGLMIGTAAGCLVTFLLTYYFGVDKQIELDQVKELEEI